VVTASAASLLVTLSGAGLFTYQHFDKAINTSADGGLVKDSQRPAEAKPNAAGQTPMNILLIGSDSRDDGNNQYGGGRTGQGARSDTTILRHIYADHQHAVGVSIPRDLLVDIPACLYDQTKPDGKKSAPQHDQFNAAFAIGDTSSGNVICTRDTLEAMSGIRIDHTAALGFEAFSKLTDDIHGVQVCVPQDVKSTNGDNITLKKGIQTLSGKSALDYVREREGLGDGTDIGRTRRQQAFLGSMIKKLETDGIMNDPTALSGLLNDALKYAQFDKDLGSLSALADFASSLKGINPSHIQFITLPGHYLPSGRVDLDASAASVIWDHLKSDTLLDGSNAAGSAGATPTSAPTSAAPTTPSDTAPSIPPASISARVLNGTSVSGLAADATTSLQARGYNAVVSRLNTPDIAVTTIVYPSGKEAAAQQLATLFPGATVSAGGSGTQIVVTLGADYATAHHKVGTTAPSSGSSSDVSALPTVISNNSRTADQDLCSDITAGFAAGTSG
jgi:LCP family protein required for cell wall assembly